VADFDLLGSTGDAVFRLTEGHPAVVGRGSTTELTLSDTSISRHHARLRPDGDLVVVEDLRSTNGTFLNGAAISSGTAADGDVVRFGNVAFTLRRIAEVPASADVGREAEEEGVVDATFLRALPVAVGTLETRLDELRAGAPPGAPLPPSQEQRLRRLELLLDVSKTFAQNVSLDRLLDTIVDVTGRIMGVHRVSILFVDARTGELQPVVSRQLGRPVEKVRLPASILRRVMEEKIAVRTDDAASDARFGGQSVVLQNVCGAMCTPLLSSSGEVLGAIYVDNLVAVGPYSDEDLEFLVTFGGIAAAAVQNSRLAEALRTKAVALSNFERYFAPELAAAIAAEGQAQLGGVKRSAAILFSDIRGFSAMSESMLPDAVVKLLNGYFSEMVDIVFDHGGTLDKFIGDAIMANWGAPLSRADDADRALRAAIEMQRELREMNAQRAAGEPRFEIGIGINLGEVFVGNIGSPRRLEYTVMGDPVNVAARLCSTAGRGEIIISDSLFGALSEKPEVDVLPPVQLRGRAATTAIYRVRW
jgi:adenylate cyclase